MRMAVSVTVVLFLFASVAHSESAIPNRSVECEGNTLIKVGDRIGAQTPFRAIFSIEEDVVNMVEGDSTHFSKSYAANEEITKPERPGYHSDNGNLFFYKASGRFEIVKIAVTQSGLKTETTSGQCKAFTPSNVFQ